MHFLLTNDDGIFAPGIRVLAEVLHGAGHRVSVCAPDRERSAASHSATLGTGLRAVSAEVPGADRAWAVNGTPADCARLGLWLTREEPADIVIAGINRGMNLGGAVLYSGTVAGAMQGAMCGVQALAVSLCTLNFDGDDYVPAARLALRVAEWMPGHPLPRGCVYSLNVPLLPYETIRGLVPATLAPVFLETPAYREEADGEGVLYRYDRGEEPPLDDPKYDMVQIDRGYATLTKLSWDWRMDADDGELGGIGL